jgi:hypothetical protein
MNRKLLCGNVAKCAELKDIDNLSEKENILMSARMCVCRYVLFWRNLFEARVYGFRRKSVWRQHF